MSLPKVLVTGATGFIGKNLCLALKNHYSVIPICRKESVNSHWLIRHGFQPQYENLLQPQRLKSLLDGVEIIFHLANANKPSTPTSQNGENIQILKNIFQSLDASSLKRIVMASSGGSIYGDLPSQKISETQPTHPITQYGADKVLSERYLAAQCADIGIPFSILRIANCYGPYQDYRAQHGFIPVALYRLLNSEPLEIWGDGSQTKDYIFIDDVIDSFLTAAKSNTTGIFNIGTGQGTSLLELIRICEQVTSAKADVKFQAAKPWDIKMNVLDISKIKNEMGWSPKVSIREGVRLTFEWIKRDLD